MIVFLTPLKLRNIFKTSNAAYNYVHVRKPMQSMQTTIHDHNDI